MNVSPPPPKNISRLILLFVLFLILLFASVSIAFSQHRPATADSLTNAQRRECLRYRAEAEYFYAQGLRKDSVITQKNLLITRQRRENKALKAGIIAVIITAGKLIISK